MQQAAAPMPMWLKGHCTCPSAPQQTPSFSICFTNQQEMAEGVIFNTAEGIIKSLGSLALQEIGLLWGFKDELQKLKDTVSTIQAVLLDAEEKQAQNHAVKDWLQKLKDAMYDADDLLDEFSTQLLRRQVMTRDRKMAKEVNSSLMCI